MSFGKYDDEAKVGEKCTTLDRVKVEYYNLRIPSPGSWMALQNAADAPLKVFDGAYLRTSNTLLLLLLLQSLPPVLFVWGEEEIIAAPLIW